MDAMTNKGTTMAKRNHYICTGSVCGDCGDGHTTLQEALACRVEHHSAIASLPSSLHGAPYSDRQIRRVDGSALSDDEYATIGRIEEAQHRAMSDAEYDAQ